MWKPVQALGVHLAGVLNFRQFTLSTENVSESGGLFFAREGLVGVRGREKKAQ